MTQQTLRRTTSALFPLALTVLSLSIPACAQDKPTDDKPAPTHPTKSWKDYAAELHTTDCGKLPTRTTMAECREANLQIHTIFLQNAAAQNDTNEILVAVRNMADPGIKIYLIASQNAISIASYPEDLARVEAYIHSIDRPHRAYRLTYTIAESDAGKRIGIQHFSMVLVAGQRTVMKQGSRVPVATGSYTTSDKASQEQFTYLDVGMNFDATLTQVGDNLQLKTKVEQSSIADVKTGFSDRDPVVRQSMMDGVSNLIPGKPVVIGALDVPGSTRHLDIEVLAEPVQ